MIAVVQLDMYTLINKQLNQTLYFMDKTSGLSLIAILTSIAVLTIALEMGSTLYSLPTITISSADATPLSDVNVSNQDKNNIDNNVTKSWPNISPNVKTSFISNTTYPHVDHSAYFHPSAVLIGDCYIGKNVLVAPTAVCRGDTGIPIHVGNFSNIQDGAIIHAAQTMRNGTYIDNKRFSQTGDKLLANDTRFGKG